MEAALKLNRSIPSEMVDAFRNPILFAPDRKKFLVVEDDFSMQPIWEQIIKTVDPRAVIRWAASGETADKMIRDLKEVNDGFDLIVADIFLAGEKNGIDLWRRFAGKNNLFLFTSGITQKTFNEMIGESAEPYPILMQKPLTLQKCVENLKCMLAHQQIFAEAEMRADEEALNEKEEEGVSYESTN